APLVLGSTHEACEFDVFRRTINKAPRTRFGQASRYQEAQFLNSLCSSQNGFNGLVSIERAGYKYCICYTANLIVHIRTPINLRGSGLQYYEPAFIQPHLYSYVCNLIVMNDDRVKPIENGN